MFTQTVVCCLCEQTDNSGFQDVALRDAITSSVWPGRKDNVCVLLRHRQQPAAGRDGCRDAEGLHHADEGVGGLLRGEEARPTSERAQPRVQQHQARALRRAAVRGVYFRTLVTVLYRIPNPKRTLKYPKYT